LLARGRGDLLPDHGQTGDPNLDPALYGECQAALLNFERVLTQEFGDAYALAESLAVSLQFSRVTPEARSAGPAPRSVMSVMLTSSRSFTKHKAVSQQTVGPRGRAFVAR
jgi:hypothetical protein